MLPFTLLYYYSIKRIDHIRLFIAKAKPRDKTSLTLLVDHLHLPDSRSGGGTLKSRTFTFEADPKVAPLRRQKSDVTLRSVVSRIVIAIHHA